jgi:hypothetical protein
MTLNNPITRGIAVPVSVLLWLACAPCITYAQWAAGPGGSIYYNGAVGIGTAAPATTLDVRSGHVIGNLYGTTTGNQWVEVGNAVTHMNLGVGASGSTSGVPYIWSASGNFFIGNDGLPTLFVNGMAGGKVGIGTPNPTYRLTVEGAIGTRDVIVTNVPWSDYVFRPDYRLRPLSELNTYIQQHHHLPGIPSEAEVKEKGISIGEMQAKLLAKIEELTLHMIKADQRINRLEAENLNLRRSAASAVVQLSTGGGADK